MSGHGGSFCLCNSSLDMPVTCDICILQAVRPNEGVTAPTATTLE
jgi:hypothetical protein